MSPEEEKIEDKLATLVAEDLQKGVMTDETVKNFGKLILLGSTKKSDPHFGNGILPDDDW
jgi:hypothetical protein